MKYVRSNRKEKQYKLKEMFYKRWLCGGKTTNTKNYKLAQYTSWCHSLIKTLSICLGGWFLFFFWWVVLCFIYWYAEISFTPYLYKYNKRIAFLIHHKVDINIFTIVMTLFFSWQFISSRSNCAYERDQTKQKVGKW